MKPQIICLNGVAYANGTVCICNPGYQDGAQDPTKPNIVVKCGQLTNSTNSNTNSTGNNGSQYPTPAGNNSQSLTETPGVSYV